MIHTESIGRKMELIGEMELAAVPSVGEDIRHNHMGVTVISRVMHVHYGDRNRVEAYINAGTPVEHFYRQYGSIPVEGVH